MSTDNESCDPALRSKVLEDIIAFAETSRVPQKQWVNRSKISQATVSRILQRKIKKPKWEDILALANAMAGSPETLAEIVRHGISAKDVSTPPDTALPKTRLILPNPIQQRATFTNFITRFANLDSILPHFLPDDCTSDGFGDCAEIIRDLLGVEACSIFVFERDKVIACRGFSSICCPAIKYIKRYDSQESLGHPHVRVAAKHFETQTCSFYVFPEADKPIAERIGHRFDYLTGGVLTAFLAVPLRDQHGRLLGLISCENVIKNTETGANHNAISLPEDDIHIFRTIISNRVSLLVQAERYKTAVRDIMNTMHSSNSLEEMLAAILRRIMDVMNADRGDLALLDIETSELKLRAIADPSPVGPVSSALPESQGKLLPLGAALPRESFIHALWRSADSIHRTGNVNIENFYHQSHSQTRSELAVRICLGGRPIGIINIESFSYNYYNKDDEGRMESLAQYAAAAIGIMWEETVMSKLIETEMETIAPDAELPTILNRILATAKDLFYLSGAIIYMPNRKTGRLECIATGGDRIPEKALSFSYGTEDVSLATHVFKNFEPTYISKPRQSPIVNQKGLDFFNISGPLIALPLIHAKKNVGVLVCWSGQWCPLTSGHLLRLKPISTLAAWTISTIEEGKRVSVEAMNNLQVNIFRKDCDGKFTYINKYFADQLGLADPEDAIGKTDFNFYPEELATIYRKDDLEVQNSPKLIISKDEPNINLRTGETGKVRVTKMPIVNSKSEIVGVQGAFIDLAN
ncbi:MAG TPA: GAF domain-containing protein [Candidatus Limnocylindria bacterium]|jgi:GAF domain-containing protein|nr:GAF domain-containing protein [Candidatus Limnocylindria bacterium]